MRKIQNNCIIILFNITNNYEGVGMKKKRRALATWKVVLITIAAIIGLLGVSIFVMFLLGYFNEETINPESISYVQDENYNEATGLYEVSDDFYMTITTATENVTTKKITLSLGNTVAENGYLDNGIIKVPEVVYLNTPFLVELSTSFNDEIGMEYINGGVASLCATSDYRLIRPIYASIAVDVPVESVTGYIYDAGDGEKTEIGDNQVVVGSNFKVEVEFSPENSGYMFSSDSDQKLVFYETTSSYISFDYETQTFTADKVTTLGYNDTIAVYTFSSAKYQNEFLSQNGDFESFEEMNESALRYFKSEENQGRDVYKTFSIDVVVKDVTVDSFEISNDNFTGIVDRYFTIASSSTSSIFDGNLGVVIKDNEGTNINSVYAGNVGIALTSDISNTKIVGENVMRVQVVTNQENGEVTYQIFEEKYDSSKSYLPTIEEFEKNYYFILPNTSASTSASNFSYKISSNVEEVTEFKLALFVESEDGWDVLGGNFDINSLQTLTITFEENAEKNVYWKDNETERFMLFFDSDENVSDSIELSEQINVPSENVYQEVRYFFYSPTGGRIDGIENVLSYKSVVQYNVGEDITLSMLDSSATTVYLYELSSTALTVLNATSEDIYIIFATVKSNADEVVYVDEDGKYEIVYTSSPRALVVSPTLKFDDLTSNVSFSSAMENNRFNIQDEEENNYLYVPSILYTTEQESDTFNITISFNNQSGMFTANDLQDLYNAGTSDLSETDAGYIKVEFRDRDGNLATYTDEGGNLLNYFEIGAMEFSDVNGTISGTASVSISRKFENTDGNQFTPHLVYNNGRTTKTKAIEISYNNETYSNFTLYAQKAESSQYQFIYDNDTRYNLDSIISVKIDSSGIQTITWGNTQILDEQDSSAVSKLSQLLNTVIFDQYGKIIYTEAASFSLVEETNKNYINIVDNQIRSFNSTNSAKISTSLNANINSLFGTVPDEVSPGQVNFEIESAGVTKVEYATSEFLTAEETYEEGDRAQGVVRKYLTLNETVSLNSLIKVYVGDSDDASQNLQFSLADEFLAEFSSEELDALFSNPNVTDSAGMLNLLNNGEKVSYTSAHISQIQIVSIFANDYFDLVFDVTDPNNIVNIQLTLRIMPNIKSQDIISEYYTPYIDYLTYGNESTTKKLAFGNDYISLNTYLPISYDKTSSGENSLEWTRNNTILVVNGTVVGAEFVNNVRLAENDEGEICLQFADVKSLSTVELTIYYNRQNNFSLRIDLGFVVNPNYLMVQKETNVYLDELADESNTTAKNLSTYYDIYVAKDYINRNILNTTNEDVSPIGFTGVSNISFVQNGILAVGKTADGQILSKNGGFVANLGIKLDSSISLQYQEQGADNTSCQFILLDSDKEILSLACSTLDFQVGYAETVSKIVNMFFSEEDGVSDEGTTYDILDNNGEYVLVLVENGSYMVYNDWSVETASDLIIFSGSRISIKQLPGFNINANLTFSRIDQNESGDVNDIIYVDVRLTKVGLIYVNYERTNEDGTAFGFDDIVTNATSEVEIQEFINNMAEKGIYDSYKAGGEYQVVYVDDGESEVTDEDFGFHYISKQGNTIRSTLDIYSITTGYEDLVTLGKTGESITDKIILKSLVEPNEDVYLVLRLTLSQTYQGNNITYVMYYRIKIESNYQLAEVTYPYSDGAEYITEQEFDIDFEEVFTDKTSATANIGKKRFDTLQNVDGTEIANLSAKYTIYDVVINGEEYEDYSQYLELNLDETTGVLKAKVLTADAQIVVRIAKNYYINDILVIRSERLYTIVYNGEIPEYVYSATGGKVNGDVTIQEDDGDYVDEIMVGGEYEYKISVSEKIGDVNNPINDVYAHFTSIKEGYSEDDYFYQFTKLVDGNKLYEVTKEEASGEVNYILGEEMTVGSLDGIKSGKYILLNEESDEITNYAIIDAETDFEIGEENVSGYVVKFSGQEMLYFLPKENVGYFDFRNSGTNGEFILAFFTKSSILENGDFSIGIYTQYLNIFNIYFTLDGGYDITFISDINEAKASGTNYDISDFISTIKVGDDSADIKDEFKFSLCDDSLSKYIKIEDKTFIVAHLPTSLDNVKIKAEHFKSHTYPVLNLESGDKIYKEGVDAETDTNIMEEWLTISETDLAGEEVLKISDFVFEEVSVGAGEEAITYIKIVLNEEITIGEELVTEFFVNKAEKGVEQETVTDTSPSYQFYFTLNFLPTTKLTQGSLVNYQESEEKEGNRYSQDVIELDLSNTASYLYEEIRNQYTNSIREGETFTFEGGENNKSITLENVGEDGQYEQNFVVEYRFYGEIIYTFNVKYIYTIHKNVSLTPNYPTPDGRTQLEEEYIDNNTTIEDFFNTQANFTTKDAKSRVYIECTNKGNGENYVYDYTLDITEIENVTLLVNDSTSFSQTAQIKTGKLDCENDVVKMENFKFNFKLNNTDRAGSVLFTLLVNNVPTTYKVIVSGNDVVTVESNSIIREQDYESVFAEDIAGFETNNLFGYNRLLKYNFLNSASGTYYLRFTKGANYKIKSVTVSSKGVDNILDMGNSYEGYTFQGVYSNQGDAESESNPHNWNQYFKYEPYLTNRIVLLYYGNIVSNDVASIKLATRKNPKLTYQIKDGIKLQESYFVRFENGNEFKVLEVKFEDYGSQKVTIELDANLQGYSYVGTYTNESDANEGQNNVGIVGEGSCIFEEISLSDQNAGITFEDMKDVKFDSNTKVDTTNEYYIGYILTREKVAKTRNNETTTEEITHRTNYSYRMQLNVRFEVRQDARTTSEVILVGSGDNGYTAILSLLGLGIRDAKTGEYLTSNDIGATRRLDIKIYGIDVALKDNPADPYNNLTQEAIAVHNELLEDNKTGLAPVYMTDNEWKDFENNGYINPIDQTRNYASVNAYDDYGSDYSILPRGSGVDGNDVMFRITYTTYLDSKGTIPITVSANLRFTIKQDYDIDFRRSADSEQYGQGEIIELEDGTLAESNTSANPYIISKDRTGQHYLYNFGNNAIYPILKVLKGQNNINEAYAFDYSMVINSAESEYNSKFDNLVLDGWDKTESKYSHGKVAQNGEISFEVNPLAIGNRSYYIDAIDNYGYKLRIYFQVQASIEPNVNKISNTIISEGSTAQIGVAFNKVDFASGEVTSENSGAFGYDFAYTIDCGGQIADDDEPTLNISIFNEQSGWGSMKTPLDSSDNKYFDYYYGYTILENEGETQVQKTYLTKDFNTVKGQTGLTSFNLYLKTSSLNGKTQMVFGVMHQGKVVQPNGINRSTGETPEYSDEAELQLTMGGFSVNVYNNLGGNVVIPAISDASLNNGEFSEISESNIQDIVVSRVWFEYKGEKVEEAVIEEGGIKLISGDASYKNIYQDGVIDVVETNKDFEVPHFSGQLYGTSSMLENVVMVVELEKVNDTTQEGETTQEGDTAQVRQTINIQRSTYGALEKNQFKDEEKLGLSAFNSSFNEDGDDSGENSGSVTIYNDTVEIQMEAKSSLEYAIVKAGETQPIEYTKLNNTRDYAHKEQIRISDTTDYIESDNTLATQYNVYIRNNTGEYNVKYFSDIVEKETGQDYYSITLGVFAENDQNGIELNIEDVSEISESTGYTTRNIYTIVEVGYPTQAQEEKEYYLQQNSVQVYPLFTSITSNRETAFEYIIDDYYQVDTADGTYYVISPTSWASDDFLNYFHNNESVSQSENKISSKPYYYTYEIEAGATIDANGVITTSTNFKIQADTIVLDVYMRVSGVDGLYDDPDGRLLTSIPLQFTLRASTNSENNKYEVVDTAGAYLFGGDIESLIVLNAGDTVYGKGKASANDPSRVSDATDSLGTYLVSRHSKFTYDERFGEVGKVENSSNRSYRIIKEGNDDEKFITHNALVSHTYDTAGKFTSIFVESYRLVDENNVDSIVYVLKTADIIVYDATMPTLRTAEYTKPTETQTTAVDGNSSFVYDAGTEIHTLTLNHSGLSVTEEISGNFYDLETGKQIVADGTKDITAQQIKFSDYLNATTSSITTKDIIVEKDGTITYYRINFFVYTKTMEEKNIAWRTNASYYLSSLLGAGKFYEIDNFKETELTAKFYSVNENENEKVEYIFALQNGNLVKYKLNFWLYSTSSTLSTWVTSGENAVGLQVAGEKIEDGEVATQTNANATIFDMLGIKDVVYDEESGVFTNGDVTYKIYTVENASELEEISENSYTLQEYEDGEEIAWNSLSRIFFVATTNGGRTTYQRFEVLFYKYVKEVDVNAVTTYNNQFMLRELDSIIRKGIVDSTGEITWWKYNEANRILTQTSYIQINSDTVQNGKYIDSENFFVLVSQKYYKVNLNLVCAQVKNSFNVFVDTSGMEDLTAVAFDNVKLLTFDITGEVVQGNENLTTYLAESLGFGVVDGIVFYDYDPSGANYQFDGTEVENVDLSGANKPYVVSKDYLIKVSYQVNTRNVEAYAMVEINFIVQETPINSNYLFLGEGSGSFDLNTISSQVRTRLQNVTIPVTFFEDENGNQLLSSLTLEDSVEYLLKEIYVKVNFEGEIKYEKILVLVKNNGYQKTTQEGQLD